MPSRTIDLKMMKWQTATGSWLKGMGRTTIHIGMGRATICLIVDTGVMGEQLFSLGCVVSNYSRESHVTLLEWHGKYPLSILRRILTVGILRY